METQSKGQGLGKTGQGGRRRGVAGGARGKGERWRRARGRITEVEER